MPQQKFTSNCSNKSDAEFKRNDSDRVKFGAYRKVSQEITTETIKNNFLDVAMSPAINLRECLGNMAMKFFFQNKRLDKTSYAPNKSNMTSTKEHYTYH